MGVGLYLSGRYKGWVRPEEPRRWLGKVQQWATGACSGVLLSSEISDEDAGPVLLLKLHPAEEAARVEVPARGKVVASARTCGAGPGYHTFLCGVLQRMGQELGIAWDPPDEAEGIGDETGYFLSGDRARVEEEMLQWLSHVASIALENDGEVAISMPPLQGIQREGCAVTPSGPRSREWLQATVQDARAGRDFFPWWEDGLGAGYLAGRALCRMWLEVPWRTPLTDEEEGVLEDVVGCLEKAYHLDPAREYPWREWQEVIECLGAGAPAGIDVEGRAAQAPAGPFIGYRRGDVQVTVGSWTALVPGSLAEEWEEEGTWCGWESDRWVRLTPMLLSGPGGSEADLPPLPEFGGQPIAGLAGLASRATVAANTEDDSGGWVLRGVAAVPDSVLVCSIWFAEAGRRPWAEGVWRSVRHRDGAAGSE